MAKRFTDTEIWEQDWFVNLPNKYKLLWLFIKDKCDNGGIWRPNKITIQGIIGEKISLDDFLRDMNSEKERIIVLENGRWFIKTFFVFQYGEKFSPESPVHRGALKKLLSNQIHIRDVVDNCSEKMQSLSIEELAVIAYGKPIDRLSIGYGKAIDSLKDKDIVSIRENIGDDRELQVVEYKRSHTRKKTDNTIQNTREKKNEDELNDNKLKPDINTGAIETPKQNPLPLSDDEVDRSYNPNIGADGGYKFDQKKKTPRPKSITTGLVFPWESEVFKERWEHWKDYLWDWCQDHHVNFPYAGAHGEQAAIVQLSEFSFGKEEEAYKIITHTMANGWKSFQKPKPEKNGNGKFPTNGRAAIDNAAYERDLEERMADAARKSRNGTQ